MVGALADLARDRQPRDRRVAPLARRPVQLKVGSACPVRVYSRLDQRPAQMRRASLGELAAPARLTRLLDDRIQASQADDLPSAAEATRLADLREQMTSATSVTREDQDVRSLAPLWPFRQRRNVVIACLDETSEAARSELGSLNAALVVEHATRPLSRLADPRSPSPSASPPSASPPPH